MKLYAAIALAIAVIAGSIGQWGFGHQVLLIGAAIYLLVPVFIVLMVVALLASRSLSPRPWLLPTLKILCMSAASLIISYGVGSGLYHWHYSRVIVFVERAHERLDLERDKTGQYPATLPADLASAVPAWLEKPGSYRSEGGSFQFRYFDPGAMMFGGWTYDSRSRQWHYED